MNELYWLTVLSNVNIVGLLLLVLGGLGTCIATIYLFCDEWEYSKEDYRKKFMIFYKTLFGAFIFGILATCFIPNKQEMYLIYGVGSVIDYLQGNPKAEQLPDKYIEILNVWADNYIDKQKKDK